MRKIVIIILSVMTLAFCDSIVSAQTINDKEITLTVSSDGTSKDEATKNALRSAIEQAYGAFVSANTTILNDELVKDEIITLSNGSIKEYKEISSVQLPHEKYNVTLSATVSLPHLIQYAQSKGSECEFAGNTFGMEMKLFELQKENELKALYNLTDQIERILPQVMKFNLEVKDPILPQNWAISSLKSNFEDVKSNQLFSEFPFFVSLDTTKQCFHYDYIAGIVNNEAKQKFQQTVDNLNDYYEVEFKIKYSLADKSLYDTLDGVLNALSLGREQFDSRGKKGLNLTELKYDIPNKDENSPYRRINKTIYLRNDSRVIKEWIQDFVKRINSKTNNYAIVDNTGQSSYFQPYFIKEKFNRPFVKASGSRIESINYTSDNESLMLEKNNGGYSGMGILGKGLYQNLFKINRMPTFPSISDKSHTLPFKYSTIDMNDPFIEISWDTSVLIPKSELGKYSKFWIEPSN